MTFSCILCCFLAKLWFTQFCRDICFVAIYALLRVEKFSQELHPWRKMTNIRCAGPDQTRLQSHGPNSRPCVLVANALKVERFDLWQILVGCNRCNASWGDGAQLSFADRRCQLAKKHFDQFFYWWWLSFEAWSTKKKARTKNFFLKIGLVDNKLK